jgi:hypothetical protein
MYQLKYVDDNQVIIQVDPTGKEVVIADDFPSRPEYSPDKKKAIYISPLEWECPGSLYLYNLENGYITELIPPNFKNQNIPKYAIWLNSETIATIIGFGDGTVSVGGNVYIYNINYSEIKQITNYPGEIQITKLTLKDDILELTGIQYIDDNFNNFKDFKEKISLNQFL